jgi:hypothetical protein
MQWQAAAADLPKTTNLDSLSALISEAANKSKSVIAKKTSNVKS